MSLAVISYVFVVFLTTALLVDIAPFITLTKTISTLSLHSLRTINTTDLDDEKKQSLLLSNALGILKVSFKILGLIILIGVWVYSLLLISFIFTLSFRVLNDFVLSFAGLILSVVAFICYFLLKKLYVKFRV